MNINLEFVVFLILTDTVFCILNIKSAPYESRNNVGAHSLNPQHRQKRDYAPAYDYPDPGDHYNQYHDYYYQHPTSHYNQYSGYGTSVLAPIGIVGGAALKAVKVKKVVKGLKYLSLPLGLATIGGIAALASGAIPPALVGGINLPFQG